MSLPPIEPSSQKEVELSLPPPPSHSDLPSSSSSSFVWPFSDPTLVFFIDPFSSKTEALKNNLERKASVHGLPFRTTTLALQASHVVLDPSCEENRFLRSFDVLEPVSFNWIKDSFLEEKALPEEDYSLPEVEDVEQDEEQEPEVVGEATVCDSYARRGKAWLVREEEDIARFLASDAQTNGDGYLWKQYQRSHPSRTVSAYASYHWKRREFLDARVAALKAANNGQPIAYQHPEVVGEDSEVEKLTTPTSIPNRQQIWVLVPTPADPFVLIASDDARTARLRKGTRAQVYLHFSAKHPRRTPISVQSRYHSNRETIVRAVEDLKRKGGKPKRPAVVLSESEEALEDDSMGDDERSIDDNIPRTTPRSTLPSANSLENGGPFKGSHPGSSKRTRIIDEPVNAVASSSGSSFNRHDPHNHSHPSFTSHFNPSRIPSTASQSRPRPSLETSFQQPVASIRSNPFSIGPQSSSSSHHPPSGPSPPYQSSSDEEDELEPPSFLEIGTKPSFCHSSRWCWFCGEGRSPTYENVSLAVVNPSNNRSAESVGGKLACRKCEKSWEKRVVRGKKLGMGVAEMGDLERLAWVTEVLIEKGLKERERRVKGRGV
ncbi:hypothetical protein BDY24DRAFT_413596 [Mrakia frigida]|uniref:uncharacterized protein n=1 Tax=Mrakia frigida TaxID=29902 RepID=UPI003FCC1F3F